MLAVVMPMDGLLHVKSKQAVSVVDKLRAARPLMTNSSKKSIVYTRFIYTIRFFSARGHDDGHAPLIVVDSRERHDQGKTEDL